MLLTVGMIGPQQVLSRTVRSVSSCPPRTSPIEG